MSRETTPTENVVAELRGRSAYPGDVNDQAAALIESQRATIERVERERDDLQERFDQLHAAKDIHAEKRHEAEARVTALEAEIARLRGALEWYAGDGSTYDGIDVGQRARAALSRSTEKNDD